MSKSKLVAIIIHLTSIENNFSYLIFGFIGHNKHCCPYWATFLSWALVLHTSPCCSIYRHWLRPTQFRVAVGAQRTVMCRPRYWHETGVGRGFHLVGFRSWARFLADSQNRDVSTYFAGFISYSPSISAKLSTYGPKEPYCPLEHPCSHGHSGSSVHLLQSTTSMALHCSHENLVFVVT